MRLAPTDCRVDIVTLLCVCVWLSLDIVDFVAILFNFVIISCADFFDLHQEVDLAVAEIQEFHTKIENMVIKLPKKFIFRREIPITIARLFTEACDSVLQMHPVGQTRPLLVEQQQLSKSVWKTHVGCKAWHYHLLNKNKS